MDVVALHKPHATLNPGRVVLRFGSMSVAVAHPSVPYRPSRRYAPMFEDPCSEIPVPVSYEYPLRHPSLYALYVTRKHRAQDTTFIDQ